MVWIYFHYTFFKQEGSICWEDWKITTYNCLFWIYRYRYTHYVDENLSICWWEMRNWAMSISMNNIFPASLFFRFTMSPMLSVAVFKAGYILLQVQILMMMLRIILDKDLNYSTSKVKRKRFILTLLVQLIQETYVLSLML